MIRIKELFYDQRRAVKSPVERGEEEIFEHELEKEEGSRRGDMGERTVNSVGCAGSAGLVPAQEARQGSHVLGHPRSHQLNSLKQPQHEQQLCEEEHRQDIIDTQDTINKL